MRRRQIERFSCALLVFFLGAAGEGQQTQPLVNAKAQIKQRQFDEAEKSVWLALSNDPSDTDALLLLGAIRREQQRYPEAEALIRRVLQLKPDSAAANKDLALLLIAQEKTDEALDQLPKAIAFSPNDVELKTQLGQIYVARKDFAKAAAVLQRIPVERFPSSAISLKAATLLAAGKTIEAAALIPKAEKSSTALLDLAEVFVGARQPILALRALEESEKYGKRSPRTFYLKGTALQLLGDDKAANESLNQALRLSPNHVLSLMAMAERAASQRQHASAVQYLERAHAADPPALPPLRRLIEEAMSAGLHGTVEKAALELEQKSAIPEDQYLTAAALLQEREFDKAIPLFESYLTKRADDGKAYYGLGLSYLNAQRYPDAQGALSRALELDPKLTDAEFSLGVLYSKEGDNQNALIHFERVLQVQPRHATALLESGTIYLQDGKLDAARKNLEAAALADPADPNTHYQLSLIYSRTGNTLEARKEMEKFRTLKEQKNGSKSQ